MFVVIPFCQKDEWLAIKQLEWAYKLDGQVNRTALLVHDDTINGAAVKEAAQRYFTEVNEHVFPVWRGKTDWPYIQNNQFQEAATHIHHKGPDDSWFWWEPDATPLKAGWLDALEDEYKKGGKPFMGHVLSGDPFQNGSNHIWMTGVGVYPRRVMAYSGNIMSAMQIPWDVAGGAQVAGQCHRANHLIQHIWAIDGAPPTFANSTEANSTLLPSAVVFHRCKDGSLINAMRGKTIAEKVSDIKDSVVNFINPKREEAQALVTAVITTHKRLPGLKAAFNSCLAAGFKKIVIAASGVDNETRQYLSNISGKAECVKAIEFPESKNSGEIWADAVDAVRTELCTILHDDDQFLPGLMSKVSKPINEGYRVVYWPAVFDNPAWPLLNEMNLSAGPQKTRLITNHMSHNGTHSISPVRGLYPTNIAAKALREAATRFGQEFMYRPHFMVGNDMLLWFRIADSVDVFYNTGEPCVRLGTTDSCTVKDIASGANGRLKSIYDKTRGHWDYAPKRGKGSRKVVVMCYVPDDRYAGIHGFLRNMEAHKAANPIVYFCDHDGEAARKLGAKRIAKQRILGDRDAGCSIHFVNMMRMADKENADYFLVLEPDVRVGKSMWDKDLCDWYWDWPFDAIACGCPVIWNPFWGAGQHGLRVTEYGSNYQRAAKVAAAWEANDTNKHPVIYPNGALAIYDLAELKLLFPGSYANHNLASEELKYYDHYVGVRLWEAYKDRIFEKMAWSPVAYSGCGERWYTEKERMEMLYSGKKVAVHQIKRDDV